MSHNYRLFADRHPSFPSSSLASNHSRHHHYRPGFSLFDNDEDDWFHAHLRRPSGSFPRSYYYQPHRRFTETNFIPMPRPAYVPRFQHHWRNYRHSVLSVVHLDFCLEENGTEHRTDNYELMKRRHGQARLVVRRGQEFHLVLGLSRDYEPSADGVSLVFSAAGVARPVHGHGTFVVAPLLGHDEPSGAAWQASVVSVAENSIKIKVIPAADAIIGKWKIEIDTRRRDSEGAAVSFTVEHPFYLIFNPWCKEDSVYLNDEDQRQEYILADTGLIWRGTRNRMRPVIWKYAQFERDILDCALFMISELGRVRISGRNDPVVLSRVLSAMVNVQDDYGVVFGAWGDDFEGGTPPTEWIGSQKILQQFYKTKKPVKYGQCWVFAGVLATVCRALGIPCRVVTNYSSAHDTQGSLTVDYFVDDEGRLMEELNSDSIWNYHVWNEVWMKRPDLAPEYDGWQVIDATPQELSEDAFRCGPASVKAIKLGEVAKPYDNGFVYAEVNADKIFWRYNGPTQPLKLVSKDVRGIGRFMSTKAVGKWEREDVTDNYKYPESSFEERVTMLKALRQSESVFSRYYLNEEFNDVKFDFELRDDIVIGQPFSVVLTMKNYSSDEDHRIFVILRVETVMYTGKVGEPVKSLDSERVVRADGDDEVRLDVSWEEYGPRLLDQCAFNISCLATVKDTNYEYIAQDDFRVRKPDIKITLETNPVSGEVLEATAKFKNPLPIPLKKGKFFIDGPGLDDQLKLKLTDVEVDGYAACRFSMTPDHEGRATIAAKFTSKELDDVDGFLNFMVKRKPTRVTDY